MRKRRVLGAAVGVCGAAWVLLACLIDRTGATPSQTYGADDPEVIVVLGARVEEDGRASLTLRTRVEHAVKQFPFSTFLFSGGVGKYGASEASVARQLAIELGVPADRCLVEEDSHSTAQNAGFSARVLRERFPRGFHVTIVTDPYHVLRARMLFERALGRSVSTSPVFWAPREREWPSRIVWTLREVPALLKDLVLR